LRFSKRMQQVLVLSVLLIVLASVTVVFGPSLFSNQQSEKLAKQQIAYDAAVYGFPLVVTDFTRQVFTAAPAVSLTGAPANQFAIKRTFLNASFAAIVNPNADTLYSAAWVDTQKEPVILSLPDTHGRYYLMPMLNYWTDCFSSPGSRTTGTEAGNYAITGPNWNGTLPEGITRLNSSTRWVWVLGRIACSGPSDYKNVWEIQDQLKLTPLSAWGTDYVPPNNVPVDPSVNRRLPPINQTLALDAASYFNMVCQLMVDNPPYTTDAPMLSEIEKIGITPGAKYTSYFETLTPDTKEAIKNGYHTALADISKTNMDIKNNGWQYTYKMADFGIDYTVRASVAYRVLGGNLLEDAFYAFAEKGADGTPLSAEKQYILHFDKDELPPANAFWSLSLYNSQILFANNSINRFNVGSLNNVVTPNADGSVDIYIQREAPSDEGKLPNWLPAPAQGDFSLTLRVYWPQESVLNGSWVPPSVQQVG
jgi:hypothetical protein